MRRFIDHAALVRNQDFIDAAYPIIGLVYGTILAFTIVIAWGQFNEAETTATNEVTSLSGLWRDAAVFPKAVCDKIHDNLIMYAENAVNA